MFGFFLEATNIFLQVNFKMSLFYLTQEGNGKNP
jgi:hypothetical protein